MLIGEISKKDLINKLYKAVVTEELASFIGAGLSITAGFKSWKEMLREPAKEIKLDVEKEAYDLVGLAQYYYNVKSRTEIDNFIKSNFSSLKNPTENHELLAQLPISTFWTTNYDKLMEKALEKYGKLPNIKTEDAHLRGTNQPFDAVIYKMHGDVDYPHKAIITRSDYENYGYESRKLFRDVFEGDLLTKTFLFLGFSFSDPNFNYVIARLRVLLGEERTRSHYCIMKKEKSVNGKKSYEQIKQELQIQDLKRYGIYTCLVDEYSEITEILQHLVNKFRRRTIFISGSAEIYAPFTEEKGKELIVNLSYALAKEGFKIINGYGLGVGTYVINGVAKYCYSTDAESSEQINDILTLMPFPLESRDSESIHDFYSKYRRLMIKKCGISIFLFGNKGQGKIAEGLLDEYEISKDLGLVSLPIKSTGGTSAVIFDYISQDDISEEYLEAINFIEENSDDVEELVEAIIKAVKILNKEDF